MQTATAHVSSKPNFLFPQSIEDIKALAAILGGRDPEKQRQAANKIIRGAELGFSAAYSCDNIHYMGEKTSISARAYGRLIKRRSPEYDYEIVERSKERATVQFLRNGEIIGTHTYTFEKAKNAGYTGRNKNWQTNPENMCFARCLSEGVVMYMPEIEAAGFYLDDEMLDAVEDNTEIARAAQDPEKATIIDGETPAQIRAVETGEGEAPTRPAASAAPVAPATILVGPEVAQGLVAQMTRKGLNVGQIRTLMGEFKISRASQLPEGDLERFQQRIDEIANATPSTGGQDAGAAASGTVEAPAANAGGAAQETTPLQAPAAAPSTAQPAAPAAQTPTAPAEAPKSDPGAFIGAEKAKTLLTKMQARGMSNSAIKSLIEEFNAPRLSEIKLGDFKRFQQRAKEECDKLPPIDAARGASQQIETLAKQHGLEAAQVTAFLKERFQTDSVESLNNEQREQFVDALSSMKPAGKKAAIAGRSGVVPMHLQ